MFRVEIETGNAAFDDDEHAEVARILRDLASRIEEGNDSGRCRDLNGNSVGTWRFT